MSPSGSNPLKPSERILNLLTTLGLLVTTILLLGTCLWFYVQGCWDRPSNHSPRSAFTQGSIGTELMPYPAFVALPKLAPDLFQPQGSVSEEPAMNYWQFGMNDQLSSGPGLPTGFYLSNKRPKSGAPSPVPFVGIACVMCHSTEVYKPNGEAEIIVGAGNANLNLFAWIDAFQSAMLRESITVDQIVDEYTKQTGEKLSPTERLMVGAWFRTTRETVKEATEKFGTPFEGDDVLKANNIPTGPSRTQPFRTLVRRLMNRSGSDMAVYTKISAVFHQDRRKWAQVDGSISDLDVRSSVAAYAAGATVQNMALKDVENNIRQASEYTRKLGAPGFFEVFPDHDSDAESVQRGSLVYKEHCHSCHGSPSATRGWIAGDRMGEIVPYTEIGTDAERVTFKGFEAVPDLIHAAYPKHHPFHFSRDEIRPAPGDSTRGYINAPIEHAYVRAPYLHNASVLTLA